MAATCPACGGMTSVRHPRSGKYADKANKRLVAHYVGGKLCEGSGKQVAGYHDPTPRLRRLAIMREARRVNCPDCPARVGSRCLSPGGHHSTVPHKGRLLLAGLWAAFEKVQKEVYQ